ncbi:MAG: hypothetical protein R2834_04370 [Rhodothermales bacterium]
MVRSAGWRGGGGGGAGGGFLGGGTGNTNNGRTSRVFINTENVFSSVDNYIIGPDRIQFLAHPVDPRV